MTCKLGAASKSTVKKVSSSRLGIAWAPPLKFHNPHGMDLLKLSKGHEGSWWCNIKWTTLIISYIDITLYQQGTLCHAVAHFHIFEVGECRRGITLITAGQSDSKPQLSWTSFSCGFTSAPLLKCMIPNVLAEAKHKISSQPAKHVEAWQNTLKHGQICCASQFMQRIVWRNSQGRQMKRPAPGFIADATSCFLMTAVAYNVHFILHIALAWVCPSHLDRLGDVLREFYGSQGTVVHGLPWLKSCQTDSKGGHKGRWMSYIYIYIYMCVYI